MSAQVHPSHHSHASSRAKAPKVGGVQKVMALCKKIPYEVTPLLAICAFSVSYGSYMLYSTSRYAPDVSICRSTNQMPWLKIDNDPAKHPKSSIRMIEGVPVHYEQQPSFFSRAFFRRQWNSTFADQGRD